MKYILLIGLSMILCSCHGKDNSPNDNVTVNMSIPDMMNLGEAESGWTDDHILPSDPCGRPTEDINNQYYTVNPDGSLSPGILTGIFTKKECADLIKTNNHMRIIRSSN